MRVKIRNLIPGALAIGALLAAWVAFGDSAQASGGLLGFDKFECPTDCTAFFCPRPTHCTSAIRTRRLLTPSTGPSTSPTSSQGGFSGSGETADIPVARRKGVPPDLRERIYIERIPFREQLENSSGLRQLSPRPGGGFLFTHHDDTALKMEPMPVLTARVWVGILSPDLSKACVDAPVPRDFDIRPMEIYRGDTLFVLDRRIDDSEKLQTWILMYLVSDEGCDWLSARPEREGH